MARPRPSRLARTAVSAAVLALFAPGALAQFVPETSAGSPSTFTGLRPMSSGAGLGGAQGTRVEPGLRTTLRVSDNLSRGVDGGEAGYRVEVEPYVRASVGTSRAQGTLRYSARMGYSSVENDAASGLRHTLNARGNALLIGDWLGVQGSANTFFTNTSAFGTLSEDPESSSLNTTRVSTMSLTPYVQGRWGSFADYRAQYTLTRTSLSGTASNLLARQNEQVQARLSSGPQFSRWGWSLQGGASTREYRNGVSLDSTSTTATLFYVFSPELRLGVSANHLYIERLTNEDGETSGWGPGLSVDWSPNRRTSLRMNVARQYYGNSGQMALSHRSQRWTFGADYSRGVYSSNNAGILTLNMSDLISAGAFAPALNPVFQQLVAVGLIDPDAIRLGAGIVNDALVRINSVRGTVGYLLPRGAVTLTVYRSERSTLLDSTIFLPSSSPLLTSSFGRFENRGLSLGVSMPLDARTTATVTGITSRVKSLDRPDQARLSSLTAAVSTKLDAKTTVSAGVRRTVQGSTSGSVSGYDANMVYGTVDLRF